MKKYKSITFLVLPEIHEKITKQAKKIGMSIATFVRMKLIEVLGEK